MNHIETQVICIDEKIHDIMQKFGKNMTIYISIAVKNALNNDITFYQEIGKKNNRKFVRIDKVIYDRLKLKIFKNLTNYISRAVELQLKEDGLV
jgi:DNA modification methylase